MDELEIGGKKYISSKRASELTGYAKDYIGQLARGGKIDATRVGRAWYVVKESLLAHDSGGQIQKTSEIGTTHTPVTHSLVTERGAMPEPQPAKIQSTQKPYSLANLRLGTYDIPKTWDSVKYSFDEEPLIPQLSVRDASEMTSKIIVFPRKIESTGIVERRFTGPSSVDGVLLQKHEPAKKVESKQTIQIETKLRRQDKEAILTPERQSGGTARLRPAIAILVPASVVAALFVAGLSVGAQWSFTKGDSNFALVYGGSDSFVALGDILKDIFGIGLLPLKEFLTMIFSSISTFFNLGLRFILSIFHLG